MSTDSGIDRFDDRARMLAAAVALPRVGEQRLFEHLAPWRFVRIFTCGPERVRRVLRGDDRELVGVQAHEVADRKQSHQVDEPLQQRLIERRIALLAHDRADARGRQPLAVRAVASERVEDVGNADDHRAEVQLAAADVLGIPAEILLQMMLEGDDRRERGHFRRPPQNVRAVHDVLLHDLEFLFVQLVGLVQDFERRVDLADVVHQRREAEFAQQRALDIEGARLGHGERRDVHHVRERVVVVLLQRRQRHQRRAVLRDEPGEAVDDLPRRARVRLVAGLGRLPQRLGRFDRRRIDAPRRRDAGLLVGHFLDDDAAERHVAHAAGDEPIGQWRG